MAESSLFWVTNGTGDGASGGYTQTQMFEWLRSFLAPSATNLGGVAPDYQNKLAVSGTSSPVSVATGAALVYGIPYVNTGAVTVAIPTPSGATRIDRIVLRANWTAQTVRITRIAGTEGGAAPSLTQSAGTTWDIPLAQASITTAGVITVTDQREYLSLVGDNSLTTAKYQFASVDSAAIGGFAIQTGHIYAGAVTTVKIADDAVTQAKIDAGAVGASELATGAVTETKLGTGAVTETKIGTGAVTTAKIADDAVTAAKVGTQVPALINRQGGSATNWSEGGATNYTTGNVRVQCGTYTKSSPGANDILAQIFYPVAFSAYPVVVATVRYANVSGGGDLLIEELRAQSVANDYFWLYFRAPASPSLLQVDISWIAIGPE